MVSTGYLVAMTPIRLKFMGKLKTVWVDDFVFNLHYRVTTIIFLTFSVLSTCNQFFGNPIECIKSSDIQSSVINSFCWIEGTFTIPRALTKAVGTEVAYPGIEKYERFLDDDEVITHKYYQWVSMVLFFQCLCFFLPHLLWKSWEKHRMRNICTDLRKPILGEQWRKQCEAILLDQLRCTDYKNKSYAYKYVFCELLNFVHVLFQFWVTNVFLGGEFLTYGLRVFEIIDEDPLARVDPMAKLFPKMTKCTFHRFGPSGSVQRYDNLCLLPINILNEKGYLVLWFWMLFLTIASFIQLVHRLIILCVPSYRWWILSNFNKMVPGKLFEQLEQHCHYGDWFVLHLLSKNLDPCHYLDIITCLALDTQPEREEKEINTDV